MVPFHFIALISINFTTVICIGTRLNMNKITKYLFFNFITLHSNKYRLQLLHRFGGKSTLNYVFLTLWLRHVWPMHSNESFCFYRVMHQIDMVLNRIASFYLDDCKYWWFLKKIANGILDILWLCHKYHTDELTNFGRSKKAPKMQLHDHWHACTFQKQIVQRKENNAKLNLLKRKADILYFNSDCVYLIKYDVKFQAINVKVWGMDKVIRSANPVELVAYF